MCDLTLVLDEFPSRIVPGDLKQVIRLHSEQGLRLKMAWKAAGSLTRNTSSCIIYFLFIYPMFLAEVTL